MNPEQSMPAWHYDSYYIIRKCELCSKDFPAIPSAGYPLPDSCTSCSNTAAKVKEEREKKEKEG